MANKYEFVNKVLGKLRDDLRKRALSSIEQHSLNKILIFGSPVEAIPELMQSFAVNTLKQWVSLKEKPLEEETQALAEIFYQLTHIHPFVNCNGRTATWLINVILKSQNSPDILLRYPGERDDVDSNYEKAMVCIDDTREPFSKHIFNCIQRAKSQPFHNVMLAQVIALRVRLSLRCQQLEKSSQFNYEIFYKAADKFIKMPADKQGYELENIVLQQTLGLLDQWEDKFIPKRQDRFIAGSLNVNPLVLYKESMVYYETTQYARAIPKLEEALTGFKQKLGETSIEGIKCYSTLISAFRENQQYDQALSTCEQALCDVKILKSTTSGNKAAEIDKLQVVLAKKYSECFYVLKQTPMDVYALALKNYHSKEYSIALYQLQHCIQQWDDKRRYKNEISTAYSTLASCQRESGLLMDALSSCDLAKSVILSAYSSEEELSHADQKKLDLIENKRKTILTTLEHIEHVESQSDMVIKML